MSAHVDKLLGEIEALFPPYIQCKDLGAVGYTSGVAILRCEYGAVMKEACELRRRNLVDDRARALELAFDFTLRKAVGETWERTGEVCVNKTEGIVVALCAPIRKELVSANR